MKKLDGLITLGTQTSPSLAKSANPGEIQQNIKTPHLMYAPVPIMIQSVFGAIVTTVTICLNTVT